MLLCSKFTPLPQHIQYIADSSTIRSFVFGWVEVGYGPKLKLGDGGVSGWRLGGSLNWPKVPKSRCLGTDADT